MKKKTTNNKENTTVVSVVLNYFMTDNLEEVMLTSNESMENVSRIKIRKIC